MLLTIDIGNTTIQCGIWRGKILAKHFTIPTNLPTYQPALTRALRKENIHESILCSVVPQASVKLYRAITELVGVPPLRIGKEVRVPIKNKYRNPAQVGEDRLVNAYAAICLYGAPSIVVDFGTAITFDVISRKNEYLGGMIVPGLQTSLNALASHTARLPSLRAAPPPRQLIGRNTKDSILGGVVYGYAGLTEHLVKKLKVSIGKNAKVIGTGGEIAFLKKYCGAFDVIEPNLILRGLTLLVSANNTSCKNLFGSA
ncbi:MAG: type III pantothenate kinase [Candidatus Omnitrophica bacterium]|nr:type III pantothenate kinase [Candidatus Omnitrophota bacterium]